MKLFLPHAFSLPGKDGELVEYKAGSTANFDGDVAHALINRFGAEPIPADELATPANRPAAVKPAKEKEGTA